MSANNFRTWVLTGAFAAVTATGAWYGAGLKTRQEAKQAIQSVQQATTEDRIRQLERVKDRLLQQKTDLQKKIDELAAKPKEQLPPKTNVSS